MKQLVAFLLVFLIIKVNSSHHDYYNYPVCAKFQGYYKSFPNVQALLAEVQFNGQPWRMVDISECKNMNFCPQNYSPVCAYSVYLKIYTTFPNKCVMNVAAQKTGLVWVEANPLQCSESYRSYDYTTSSYTTATPITPSAPQTPTTTSRPTTAADFIMSSEDDAQILDDELALNETELFESEFEHMLHFEQFEAIIDFEETTITLNNLTTRRPRPTRIVTIDVEVPTSTEGPTTPEPTTTEYTTIITEELPTAQTPPVEYTTTEITTTDATTTDATTTDATTTDATTTDATTTDATTTNATTTDATTTDATTTDATTTDATTTEITTTDATTTDATTTEITTTGITTTEITTTEITTTEIPTTTTEIPTTTTESSSPTTEEITTTNVPITTQYTTITTSTEQYTPTEVYPTVQQPYNTVIEQPNIYYPSSIIHKNQYNTYNGQYAQGNIYHQPYHNFYGRISSYPQIQPSIPEVITPYIQYWPTFPYSPYKFLNYNPYVRQLPNSYGHSSSPQ